MLILTRYSGQRILVRSPSGTELWISVDDHGLYYGDPLTAIPWGENANVKLDGETVIIAHIQTSGRYKVQHRIGIQAEPDYLILREELLNKERKEPCLD